MKERPHTLIDLAEDHNTRKLGLRIVRNGRMEDEDAYLSGQNAASSRRSLDRRTHITAMLCRHVDVRLLDKHCNGFEMDSVQEGRLTARSMSLV